MKSIISGGTVWEYDVIPGVTVRPVEHKDEPPRDTPEPLQLPVAATDEAPTAAKYREILVRHRRTQLQDIRANLQRMAQTYDRAAEIIAARVRALPDTVERTGTGWLAVQLNAMADIRVELERLRTDYGNLLDLSMISSAQAAADREAEVARLVGAPIDPNLYVSAERAVTLTTGEGLAVRFGTLAKEAVEGVANRYYRDGLILSDRLWNLAEGTRMAVEDTIQAGIASGQSARNLATDIQRVMTADGVQTPRYRAMRIARTEVNHAFHESTVKSAIDPTTGLTKSYLIGTRWNLSLSHPAPDVCDCYATHDEGLGPGVYSPDSFPVGHPHCLCNATSVLKEFPEVGMSGKKPNTGAIARSELERYAREGDKPAQALLAKL